MKTIETYCVSCKKNSGKENSIVGKNKQDRSMLLSNCTVCDKKRQDTLKIKNFFK